MITKQAFLNLAAVDEDYAAELEKVAINWSGLGQRFRSGMDYLKNKFGPAPAPGPTPPPRNNFNPELRRRLRARRTAIRDFGNYMDGQAQGVFTGDGKFLGDSVTAGQARAGWRQMQGALRAPGKVDQGAYNQGLINLAKGVGKTGLLFGGLGYGGYRMLRNDNSDAPIAKMYHQAMPY